MKKLIAVAVSVLLLLALTACTYDLGNGVYLDNYGIYKSNNSTTEADVGNSEAVFDSTATTNSQSIGVQSNQANPNSTAKNSTNGNSSSRPNPVGPSANNTTSTKSAQTSASAVDSNQQPSGEVSSTLKPLSYAGVSESAYVTWTESALASAKAYYKLSSASTYTEADKELIREDGTGKARVDFLGLKAGTYDLRVHVGGANADIEVKNVQISAYDRSGYAHFKYTDGVGAYNDDGTLKSGIKVVYITEATKNTNKLVASLQGGNVCVRMIGRVSCPQYTGANKLQTNITDISGIKRSNLGDDSYWNMIDVSGKSNITFEGVGINAEAYQWGVTFKSCKSVEVRNLTFTDYPEDACAFEGSQTASSKFVGRYWVHNNQFNTGKNGWDLTSEHDKGEGDGATDIKKCSFATYSYNKYVSCHKTGLVGGDDKHYQSDITMHHNYYYKTYSRTPLARQANIHMYNNFFESCGSYCVSLRANSYLFSEANYVKSCTFRDSKTGGECKSFNDVFSSASKGDITVVTSRTATVSNSCIYGKNFDTDATNFYYNSANKTSSVSYLTDATQAMNDCKNYAGVGKANLK